MCNSAWMETTELCVSKQKDTKWGYRKVPEVKNMEFIYLQLRKENRWMEDKTRETQLLTHALTCTTEILFCLKRYLSEKKKEKFTNTLEFWNLHLKKKKKSNILQDVQCISHPATTIFTKVYIRKLVRPFLLLIFLFFFFPSHLPPSHHISLNHSAVNCHLWRELISICLLNGCYIPPVDLRQCNMKQAGLAL